MKPLLIVNADVPTIPGRLRLSDYRQVVYTQDTSAPNPIADNCRPVYYPVSTIEERAFQLADNYLSSCCSLPKNEHDAVVKNLIQFRGMMFYVAVLDFILSTIQQKEPVHIVSGLHLDDLRTLLPRHQPEIARIFRANNSLVKKDLLKPLAIGLVNRLAGLFRPRRRPVHSHLFLVPTLTAWKMLEPLWHRNQAVDILFRDNLLNRRKRDFAGYLKKKKVPFSPLRDYPALGSSLAPVWQAWLGSPRLDTLISFYRREFARKARLWRDYLHDTPVRHLVMLEEFLDTANVLDQVKRETGWPLKTYNFMHGAGYYYGITPVDRFAVFGEFYREIYTRMGNEAARIEVVENPQFQAPASQRQTLPPRWREVVGERPIITYFSQYTRGSSTVGIRLQIEKWLTDYCRKHDCQTVIKLHPAETESIYSRPEIIVLKNEFPLETFFHGSMATVTFYSFTAIESIFAGCPVVIANPEKISGLYVFDELGELQVNDYRHFAGALNEISKAATSGDRAILHRQQQLAARLFHRQQPGSDRVAAYCRIIGFPAPRSAPHK